MSYLNCARCGLEIKIQAAYMQIANCPRCLARSATAIPMTLSSGPLTHAAGWGARPHDHPRDAREPGQP